jgi:hypothetical protein
MVDFDPFKLSNNGIIEIYAGVNLEWLQRLAGVYQSKWDFPFALLNYMMSYKDRFKLSLFVWKLFLECPKFGYFRQLWLMDVFNFELQLWCSEVDKNFMIMLNSWISE